MLLQHRTKDLMGLEWSKYFPLKGKIYPCQIIPLTELRVRVIFYFYERRRLISDLSEQRLFKVLIEITLEYL